jgi:hypothetical protein
MSIRVMSAVFDAEGLTSSEKIVALALADHCHDDGTEARPGLKRIETKTALSRRTVQAVIKSLISKGVMALDKRSTPTDPNWYRFILTPDGRSLAAMGGAVVAPGGCSGCTPGGAVVAPGGCSGCTLIINEPSIEPSSSTHTPAGSEKWSDDVKSLTALLCDWNVLNGYKAFTLGPKQWADMDKLLRIDKHPADEVRQVIEWCQGDAFWNANIRSTFKLRKQYDSLVGRMRQEGISLGPKAPTALSPDNKYAAIIFDAYDQGEEWYFEGTGELLFDNPSALGYTRPRDEQGNMVDANGLPYKLDAQGRRTRVEA